MLDNKQYLSEGDLRLLDVGDLEFRLRAQAMQMKKMQGTLLQLEVRLLQEKLKVNSYELLDLKVKDKEAAQLHKQRVDELKTKHNIPEEARWGYDPISGAIVVDEGN